MKRVTNKAGLGAVQVFLQHCETELFVDSENGWSADRNAARDFHDSASAVAHALNHSLVSVQIVVPAGHRGRNDVVIPVSCGANGPRLAATMDR